MGNSKTIKFNILFNIPASVGNEFEFISSSLRDAKNISGDGEFTQSCEQKLSNFFGSPSLLVSSATSALEMMALLLDIKAGDEIIIPSYTFVSTANAFILRGATIVFADCDSNGNISIDHIEKLITEKTKAVCIVHYAGFSCDMDRVQKVCKEREVYLLEDAAQAIFSSYKGKPLGTFGTFACISFHQTKNITCGEGGALIVNDPNFLERAYIIKQKGTNRRQFINGIVEKYSWVDIGSSYLVSEISAAYLLAQLNQIDAIHKKREKIWQAYSNFFSSLPKNGIHFLNGSLDNQQNWHMFALLFQSKHKKLEFQAYLQKLNIESNTHYLPLHEAVFVSKNSNLFRLDLENGYRNTKNISDTILRLPIYYNLLEGELEYVLDSMSKFFQKKNAEQKNKIEKLREANFS